MQIYIRKHPSQQKNDLEEGKAINQATLEEPTERRRGHERKKEKLDSIRKEASASIINARLRKRRC